MRITILHEDNALLAVLKPSGVLSAPGRDPKAPDLLSFFREARSTKELFLVHRLDRDTSGVFLLAKTPQAHRQLNTLFSGRKIKKHYLALCGKARGGPDSPPSKATLPLAKKPDPHTHKVYLDFNEKSGRSAETAFRLISQKNKQDLPEEIRARFPSLEAVSLIEACPLTGRTHQIRAHLNMVGYPILFDHLYGPFSSSEKGETMFLHAWKLYLPHPLTDAPLDLEAPPGPQWGEAFRRMGIPFQA